MFCAGAEALEPSCTGVAIVPQSLYNEGLLIKNEGLSLGCLLLPAYVPGS